jgi:hypothetical protein
MQYLTEFRIFIAAGFLTSGALSLVSAQGWLSGAAIESTVWQLVAGFAAGIVALLVAFFSGSLK